MLRREKATGALDGEPFSNNFLIVVLVVRSASRVSNRECRKRSQQRVCTSLLRRNKQPTGNYQKKRYRRPADHYELLATLHDTEASLKTSLNRSTSTLRTRTLGHR